MPTFSIAVSSMSIRRISCRSAMAGLTCRSRRLSAPRERRVRAQRSEEAGHGHGTRKSRPVLLLVRIEALRLVSILSAADSVVSAVLLQPRRAALTAPDTRAPRSQISDSIETEGA